MKKLAFAPHTAPWAFPRTGHTREEKGLMRVCRKSLMLGRFHQFLTARADRFTPVF